MARDLALRALGPPVFHVRCAKLASCGRGQPTASHVLCGFPDSVIRYLVSLDFVVSKCPL